MNAELEALTSKLHVKREVIEGPMSWLHYRLTALSLVAFSMVGPMISFMGEAISCNPVDDISVDLLNVYCLIHSTFSVVDAWEKEVGVEVPYPGVDTHVQGQEKVYHSYYMWVPLVLAFKAMSFYAPRFLWKIFENGRVRSVASDLKYPILDESDKEKKVERLVKYTKIEMGKHGRYFAMYMVSEVLYLANVLLQMYFVHLFLGGRFFGYGTDFVESDGWVESVKYNPMVRVFPRMAKCSYFKFSRTGTVDRRNTLCVLPLNLFNEKIYVLLWFWFVILSILTFSNLVVHFVLICFRPVRYAVLKFKVGSLHAANLRKCAGWKDNIGDWFMLYLLGKNIDHFTFCEYVGELSAVGGGAKIENIELKSDTSDLQVEVNAGDKTE